MKELTRRRFLLGATGTTLAIITGCASRGRSEEAEPTLTSVPPATRTPGPSATGTPASQLSVPDTISITPNGEFYTTFWKDPSVGVDIDTWRLEIGGLVDRPLSLSYDEILGLPAVEEMRTVECIGNPVGGNQIGNAVWKGFYLEQLLQEVGVHEDVVRAQFAAADAYWTSVDLEWITQPGVLMAYEMNGEPLPVRHGYPLRILMPGLYGQKMPKWITHIRFTAEVVKGYWEGRGWSDIAAVQTNSQIQQPRNLAVVEGEVLVSGVAYAAPREVTRVELGINGEEWIDAELVKGPSPLAWTEWYAVWRPAPGDYTLTVRATDSDGFTQAAQGAGVLDGAYPDGTNAIHDVVVSVAEREG
jgi:DMSO/TMAO reductase YedYZ molybdopterin-dependent catalytic subunit